MNNRQKLLSDLIFSEKVEYEIPFYEYIDNIKSVNDFYLEIMEILSICKIQVIEDVLIITEKKNIWSLKIKRK